MVVKNFNDVFISQERKIKHKMNRIFYLQLEKIGSTIYLYKNVPFAFGDTNASLK